MFYNPSWVIYTTDQKDTLQNQNDYFFINLPYNSFLWKLLDENLEKKET